MRSAPRPELPPFPGIGTLGGQQRTNTAGHRTSRPRRELGRVMSCRPEGNSARPLTTIPYDSPAPQAQVPEGHAPGEGEEVNPWRQGRMLCSRNGSQGDGRRSPKGETRRCAQPDQLVMAVLAVRSPLRRRVNVVWPSAVARQPLQPPLTGPPPRALVTCQQENGGRRVSESAHQTGQRPPSAGRYQDDARRGPTDATLQTRGRGGRDPRR